MGIELEYNENESVEKNLGKAFATVATKAARRGHDAMKLRAVEIVAKTRMRFDGASKDENEAAEFAVKMFRGAVLERLGAVDYPETVVLTSLVDSTDDAKTPVETEAAESQAEAEAAR